MPTFADHFCSFAMICDDFLPSGDVSRSLQLPDQHTAEVLQFSKTVAVDTGMLVYQNSEATSAYCFGLMMWR